MDSQSGTILRLLQFAAAGLQVRSGVQFVSPAELLADVLEGLVQASDLDSASQALSSFLDSRRSITDTCATIARALAAVNAHPDAALLLPQRLAQLDAIVDRLLALHHGTSSALFTRAHVHLADPLMLRGLQLLTIPGTDDQPETRMISALPGSGERTGPRASGPALLDRVQVSYERDSPYPRLTVTTPSMAKVADWAPDRSRWQQRDNPSYDLTLLNARTREIGRVVTQRVVLPLTVAGEPFSVTLADLPGVTVLGTTLTDANGMEIVRWLRITVSASQ